MKIYISSDYVFLLVLVICVLQTHGCGRRNIVPGGVYATPAVRDLGVVLNKNIVTGEFKIVNTNKYPVNIRNVKLSCGCADMLLSKETILSGESVDAAITVKLDGKYGHSMFEALVMTDDIATPVITLHLIVNVAKKKLDGTVVLDLGLLGPSDKIDQSFSILPGKAESVSVENIQNSVTSSEPRIDISASVSPSNDIKLRVLGYAPTQNGDFTISATLKSVSSEWGEADVQLCGIVRPYISIPDSIYMVFLDSGESTTKSVNVVGLADFFSKYSIEDMKLSNQLPDFVDVKFIKSQNPHIEISLKHSGNAETFTQKVDMEFSISNGQKYQLTTHIVARFL